MNHARLIIDPPAVGVWNMAMDQALLQSANDQQQITLRFYQWSKPTLSLGYFQKVADRDQHAASGDCSLVRRTSGGGAILHDHELTYSICVPDSNRWSRASLELYDVVHRELIEVLGQLNIEASLVTGSRHSAPGNRSFLCFQRLTDGDVVVDAAKICGSAQRRLKNALIQHGSILLKRSAHAPELLGIEELCDQAIDVPATIDELTNRIRRALELDLVSAAPSASEREMAERIAVEQFGSDNWTLRR